MSTFDIGDAVRVRTAQDKWLHAVVIGLPEGQWVDGCKAHDFPVIRVRVMGLNNEIPWPLGDVVREEATR